VHQTHWTRAAALLTGTGSWYDDAVGGANLGNTASNAGSNASAKTAWLDGGFFVYRQYNSIVDFSSGGSWNTDVAALDLGSAAGGTLTKADLDCGSRRGRSGKST